MNISLGLIGVGNMGSAMLYSIAKSGLIPSEKIFIYDIDQERLKTLQRDLGVNVCNTTKELIEKAEVIILAVKPNTVKLVLEPFRDCFDARKMLISIAVGIPISFYTGIIGIDKKVVRVMPNTPALVGEGMSLISYHDCVKDMDKDIAKKLFESLGKVETLDEKLMNEVTALTGSSPAYVFMFIEAMADAAVLSGIPRNIAYTLAAQAVLGSAKMVLETGKHPGELKDQVCSPAGTTIEAVNVLEKNGFRYAIMEAMDACTKRAREIGKTYGS